MITLDATTHIYSDETGREYTSVSRVINTVIAKSFDGVDPAVLANAADRGIRTERYATEILKNGWCEIQAGTERADVSERVEGFWNWYKQTGAELISEQQIVSDETNGIAGSLDWTLLVGAGDWIVDLKCTSAPEPAWAGSGVVTVNPSLLVWYRSLDPRATASHRSR